MKEYRRLATLGHSFNIDAQIMSPAETKAIFPLLNEEVIEGGLYNPGDGVVDPSSYCSALLRSARKNGAKVVENCSVEGIKIGRTQFGARHVQGVSTSLGNITTNCVVNCSGMFHF